MLGTMIKHEWKATWKVLTIVNALTIIMAILGKFGSLGSRFIPEDFQMLYVGFYILAIFASSVATFIILILRFYKNIFTEQGYLTNTLPLTTGEKLNAKLITFFFWSLINVVCIIVSILIFTLGSFSDFTDGVNMGIKLLNRLLGSDSTILSLAYWAVFFLALFVSSILSFYFSISFGCSFNKNKIFASILTYVALHVVMRVLGTGLTLITGAVVSSSLTSMLNINVHLTLAKAVFELIIYYIGTYYLMSRKLNLN